MASASPTWPAAHFNQDPRFIVGRRERGHLVARRVELVQSSFAELEAICTPYAEQLVDLTPRRYEPYAALEAGEEYFWIDVGDLPPQVKPVVVAGQSNDGTADLVRLVRGVDLLDVIDPRDLDDRILFWAACWETDDNGRIGFVRRQDPHRLLQAKRFFGFRGEALAPVKAPDIVLDQNIDVVVSAESIAAFNAAAFNGLFSDVQVLMATVSDSLKRVVGALANTVPLSADAEASLEDAARSRVSFARRLDALPDRLAGIALDEKHLRAELKRLKIPATKLLDQGKIRVADAEGVERLLSVLEGRYFNDGFGGEHRRADRWSKRT